MRLLLYFFALSVLIYYLTGLPKKYSRRQRLIFAIAAYAVLYLALVAIALIRGGIP